MGKRVRIKDRYDDVFLPNGRAYDGGQEAVLTDAEYALLTPAVSATLTLVGSETDPARPSSEPATQGDLEALQASVYASFVRGEARDGAGTFTTGNVVLIGEHAYAAGGIATAAVLGGATNYENVIGGNTANVNTPTSNLTGATALVAENGNWSFIHGGYDNVVNGWACSVMGYHCKVEANANHATISGGSIHTITAAARYATIAGGTVHTASAEYSTIGGGSQNTASGNYGTIGGGQFNAASAAFATIAGGYSHVASDANATVGGGNDNSATANSATVGGGLTNTASGIGAVVPGGRSNTASGNYSVATGRGAVASDNSEHAHGAGSFAVAGDAQINRWALKRQTTDATAADLQGESGFPPTIPENTTWAFRALVVARRADVDGENAAWEVKGLMKRDAGNTAALVGTPTVSQVSANAGNTWTLTTGAYSVGTLRLIATGEAAKTVRWVASVDAAQVGG